MTESDWQNAADPQAMLHFLRTSGQLSERKARLFAVACCRRVWCLLDQVGTAAVAVAERYADGATNAEELQEAVYLTEHSADGLAHYPDYIRTAGWAAHAAVVGDTVGAADLVAESAGPEEKVVVQPVLLHDLFGPLPFRPITVAPALLRWHDGTVVRLAHAAYDGRRLPAGILEPDRLAVLADALEEAGCGDREILAHLREPGAEHVRGCWCVDAILGRS
jgi:hypothetical protein